MISKVIEMPSRSKGEYYFEYRLRKKLEEAGWLMIKCASSRPYDIIAIKDLTSIVVEVKHKDGRYPPDQEEMQIDLAKETGNNYLLLWQSQIRGRIDSTVYHVKKDDGDWLAYAFDLLEDLGMDPEACEIKEIR